MSGGDPINYLKFGREMRNFYAAHVREPGFPAATRLGLDADQQRGCRGQYCVDRRSRSSRSSRHSCSVINSRRLRSVLRQRRRSPSIAARSIGRSEGGATRCSRSSRSSSAWALLRLAQQPTYAARSNRGHRRRRRLADENHVHHAAGAGDRLSPREPAVRATSAAAKWHSLLESCSRSWRRF